MGLTYAWNAMAAKKKTSPLAPLPSRALEHGFKAAGARYLKPGFALTPELDLAFALGYGCGFGPLTLLPDLAPGKKPARDRSLNRNVAIAELRGGYDVMMAGGPYPENPEPIDEAEAAKILTKQVPLLNLVPAHYLALEAMVGPSVVLKGIVSALDSLKPNDWNNGRPQGLFFILKGLLLRVLPEEEKAARAHLEALLQKNDDQFAAANLAITLHGRSAVEKRGYKYLTKYKSFGTSDSDAPASVGDLLRCDDAPEWVAAQFAALWTAFGFKAQSRMAGPSPARLFFLGGEPTLETELRAVVGYPGTLHADAFASYKELASPLAIKLVTHLAGPQSKVQKAAKEWLSTHG